MIRTVVKVTHFKKARFEHIVLLQNGNEQSLLVKNHFLSLEMHIS